MVQKKENEPEEEEEAEKEKRVVCDRAGEIFREKWRENRLGYILDIKGYKAREGGSSYRTFL